MRFIIICSLSHHFHYLDLILMIATAVVATFVEIVLVAYDVFSYHPDFQHLLGVPIWIPLLYALASIFVGNLARKLRNG